MDEQNFQNGQQSQSGDNGYQDYTANVQQYQAPPQNDVPNKANGMQIASLVLGIIGIPGCCCYGIVGLIMGIVGLILALVGNKRSKSGVGIAGLICSIIAILLGIAATIYYALIIQAMYFGTGPFADMVEEMLGSSYYNYYQF